jgi:pimeloyl-ACP methyl ester carboxylesterase
VISNILRWSGNTLLALLILIVLVVVAFRMAASIRETHTRADLAPPSGHLVPTRSGGVFVQEYGPADGTPVVLFHGTAAWSELWRHTSSALAAAGFHVIALDLPPFGFSDRPGSYTRQDQAARINDVLVHLKARPAIVVGHSFGAGAATELAMRYPNRARGLVLVDAALGLTAAPSDPPWIIEPKWIREILVSLTITNPVATKTLLESLIAKKERALPEFVAILQRPTTQRDTTSDIADWLYYFLGADRSADSADRNAYARINSPSPSCGATRITLPRSSRRSICERCCRRRPPLPCCPGSVTFRKSKTRLCSTMPCSRRSESSRASVPIESEPMLYILV